MFFNKVSNINISRRILLKQLGFVTTGALFFNESLLELKYLDKTFNNEAVYIHNELADSISFENIYITPYQKSVIKNYLS